VLGRPLRQREYAGAVQFLNRLLHRRPPEPHVGPQGEEYEILKAERRHADERAAFAENVIKKFAHKNLPFLDDPYR
jgi:hypothetical protein